MSRSPETLGDYKALAHLAGWHKAESWLDSKIAEAPLGAKEPVIAHGSQLVPVLLALEGIGPIVRVPRKQTKPLSLSSDSSL